MQSNVKRVGLKNTNNGAEAVEEGDTFNTRLVAEVFNRRVARHLRAAGANEGLILDIKDIYNLRAIETASPDRAASQFLGLTNAVANIVDEGGGAGFVDSAVIEYLGGHDPGNVAILVRRMREAGVVGPSRALVAEHALALMGATDRSQPALRPVWAEIDRLGSAIAMVRRMIGVSKVVSTLPDLVNAWLSGHQPHLDETIMRLTTMRGKTMARAFAQAELRARS